MAALGVKNLDCRAGRRRSSIRPPAAPATSSTRPSPASSRPTPSSSSAPNPRHEAAVLNARIRKRWRMGEGVPIGVIGEAVDLTYPYDYLGAGPQTLAELAAGNGRLRQGPGRGQAAAGHRRAGRAGPPRRRGGAGAGGQDRHMARGRDEGWNGLAVLHTAAGARRRPRSRLRAGRRRPRHGRHGRRLPPPGELDVALPARRRRDRHAGPRRAPSSSTSAPTATPAPTAPTSSCPAPPIPRNRPPTSTPRAACR